jgi:hypothetical protein
MEYATEESRYFNAGCKQFHGLRVDRLFVAANSDSHFKQPSLRILAAPVRPSFALVPLQK